MTNDSVLQHGELVTMTFKQEGRNMALRVDDGERRKGVEGFRCFECQDRI